MRDLYTRERLDHALRLKAQGMTWSVIAERMGVPQNSLEVTISRYRRGKLLFADERLSQERQRIETLAESGERICDIARTLGFKRNTVCQRLNYMGIDAELRSQFQKDRLERVAA